MGKKSEVRGVTKRIRRAYEKADKYVEQVRGDFEITCSEGCAHCCKQLVMCTLPEALLAVDSLRQDVWRWNDLKSRLDEQVRWLMSPFSSVERWFLTQRPCVFLRNDRCEVYENRPIMCRIQLVVSNPEECRPPISKTVRKLNLDGLVRPIYETGKDAMRSAGMDVYLLPMPVSLKLATEVWESGFKSQAEVRTGIWESEKTALAYWKKKLGLQW